MTVMQSVLSFDGEDDYVSIPPHPALDLTDDYTLEAWICPIALGGRIMDKGINGQAVGFTFDTYGGLRLINTGIIIDSASVQVNQWQHVAATFKVEKKGAKLFVNGKIVRELKPKKAGTKTDLPVHLGSVANSPDGFFKGKMAEVRLWSRVRTPEEIRSHLHSRLKGNEPGLVGYFPCNEGSGNIVSDKSPTQNNGSVNGATWEQAELPIAPSTESATGLEDYGYWYRWKQSLPASAGTQKNFRRGRIWC